MKSTLHGLRKSKIVLVIGLLVWIVLLWGALDLDFRTNFLKISGNLVLGGDYDGEPDIGCVERPALVQSTNGSIRIGNVKACVWE